MEYLVVIGNGDDVTETHVGGVKKVVVKDGIYTLYGEGKTVLFSSPSDSLVYMTALQIEKG